MVKYISTVATFEKTVRFMPHASDYEAKNIA